MLVLCYTVLSSRLERNKLPTVDIHNNFRVILTYGGLNSSFIKYYYTISTLFMLNFYFMHRGLVRKTLLKFKDHRI